MSVWNDFVKKIYNEGHSKNPSYLFKHALQDASERKSEMGASVSSKVTSKSKKRPKSRKSRKSRKGLKKGKSRKMRKANM